MCILTGLSNITMVYHSYLVPPLRFFWVNIYSSISQWTPCYFVLWYTCFIGIIFCKIYVQICFCVLMEVSMYYSSLLCLLRLLSRHKYWDTIFSRVAKVCTFKLRFVTCLLDLLFQYPLPCHSVQLWGPKMRACSLSSNLASACCALLAGLTKAFCTANCCMVGYMWNTGPGALDSLYCRASGCTYECIESSDCAGWPFTLTWCYMKGAGYFQECKDIGKIMFITLFDCLDTWFGNICGLALPFIFPSFNFLVHQFCWRQVSFVHLNCCWDVYVHILTTLGVSLAPFSCPASANPLCSPPHGVLPLFRPLPRRPPLPRAAAPPALVASSALVALSATMQRGLLLPSSVLKCTLWLFSSSFAVVFVPSPSVLWGEKLLRSLDPICCHPGEQFVCGFRSCLHLHFCEFCVGASLLLLGSCTFSNCLEWQMNIILLGVNYILRYFSVPNLKHYTHLI